MAPVAILGMVFFAFIGGEIIMHLWNWLVPQIVGWRQITFWQALGLLVLCRILFGGLGWRGHVRSNMRRRWEQRWDQMTPEEREKVRGRWRGRCGPFEPPSATPTE
ncbi:MAG: hypothetical protein DMG65_15285 [Candidatus Angelobacter sp. Gp1-AA117]|nr:MAG: hypothetical protein DMG65_15285 [Candidatus Angelobacter sp. Gp1-AA117]